MPQPRRVAQRQLVPNVILCQTSVCAKRQFVPNISLCQTSVCAKRQFVPNVSSCQTSRRSLTPATFASPDVARRSRVTCLRLLRQGMLPLVYSTIAAERDGVGWRRRGRNVCYYQNHIKRRSGYYYTLSFDMLAENEGDILYLAYCHPYTLTDLYR